MRFPRRRRTPTPSEHADAMTDLRDKDREIDNLLTTADALVGELRASLAQASAVLQDTGSGEEDDDNG